MGTIEYARFRYDTVKVENGLRRSNAKRYSVSLSICLSISAMHIESAHSFDTE